jgi:hypothetical protein
MDDFGDFGVFADEDEDRRAWIISLRPFVFELFQRPASIAIGV